MASDFPELVFNPVDDFTADRLNRAMATIDARLRAQESLKISYEEAVDTLNRYGLLRLNEAVQPVYERLMTISRVGMVFTVVSTTPNRIGKGEKTFVVPEDRRKTFAPSAYLQILSNKDNTKSMFGATVSYNENTGVLVVAVDQSRGTDDAVMSDWTISAAAAPDLNTSATKLGVYSQAQSDQKIAEVAAQSDQKIANAVAQSDQKIAEAVGNRLQIDSPQNLSTAAQRQALSNLGVSDYIKDLLARADAPSARALLDVPSKADVAAAASAAADAQNSRVAKAGDTMTGKLTIQGAPLEINFAAPYLDLVYGNVMRARQIVDGNGNWILRNGDNGDNFFYVTPGGGVWTKQFGDLNGRIEARGQAWGEWGRNQSVTSGRWVYAGEISCNEKPGSGGFISPLGPHTMSCDYWTWRVTSADGLVWGAPGFLRYRAFQIFIATHGWVTCGAAS